MRDNIIPKLQAVNSHDLRLCHEMKNKVLQAEMKLRASLAREESRGMHYRADFPYRDDKNFLCYVALQKGADGRMTVSRIDVKDEWKGDLSEDYASRYSHSFFPGEAEALKLPVEKKARPGVEAASPRRAAKEGDRRERSKTRSSQVHRMPELREHLSHGCLSLRREREEVGHCLPRELPDLRAVLCQLPGPLAGTVR